MTEKGRGVKSVGAGVLLVVMALALPELQAAEVPKIVCIECHGTLPGRLGEPVRLWRESIHAENGIACNACHGGDPQDSAAAMSPARGFVGVPKERDIPSFCGRCHVGVLGDYRGSAHGRALGRGGPTCVSCHGNHLVVRATLALINDKSCSRCHGFERARLIRDAMAETEGLIIAVGGRIEAYKRTGTDVDRLEKGLFSLRNRFHSLFHSVDTARVRGDSAKIRVDLKKLADELQAMDEAGRKRKLAGGVAVCGALLAAALFHLLGKSYR